MNAQKSKSEYLLLLSGDEWYNHLSPEELQALMSQCKAWFDRLAEQGKAKAGQALVRDGATVSGKQRKVLADGPFAETKEAIGGYLLLEADSLEEAIAVAQTNPTLAYGTTIDVRPVAEECPLDARARQLAREEQLAHATA